jgi:hypothetical protein
LNNTSTATLHSLPADMTATDRLTVPFVIHEYQPEMPSASRAGHSTFNRGERWWRLHLNGVAWGRVGKVPHILKPEHHVETSRYPQISSGTDDYLSYRDYKLRIPASVSINRTNILIVLLSASTSFIQ